jgi:hypothetical protein
MPAQVKSIGQLASVQLFPCIDPCSSFARRRGGASRVLKKRIEIFFPFTTIHCADVGDQRVVARLAIEMPGPYWPSRRSLRNVLRDLLYWFIVSGGRRVEPFCILQREWNRGLAVNGPGQDTCTHALVPLCGVLSQLSRAQRAVARFPSTFPIVYLTWHDR